MFSGFAVHRRFEDATFRFYQALSLTTNRCRIRRTIGATTNTVGKAITQDDSQAETQLVTKSGVTPVARNVATLEISSDIKHERRNPKAMCSSLLGMNGRIEGLRIC